MWLQVQIHKGLQKDYMFVLMFKRTWKMNPELAIISYYVDIEQKIGQCSANLRKKNFVKLYKVTCNDVILKSI